MIKVFIKSLCPEEPFMKTLRSVSVKRKAVKVKPSMVMFHLRPLKERQTRAKYFLGLLSSMSQFEKKAGKKLQAVLSEKNPDEIKEIATLSGVQESVLKSLIKDPNGVAVSPHLVEALAPIFLVSTEEFLNVDRFKANVFSEDRNELVQEMEMNGFGGGHTFGGGNISSESKALLYAYFLAIDFLNQQIEDFARKHNKEVHIREEQPIFGD